jgi:NAD(P)-dependent dehydrogenase (short-subunit alcohol dehydrogenase family)
MRLEGRAALVTGGGTGIGEAVARRLHAEGARVTVSGRREAPLKALADEIGCHWVAGDVSVAGDARRMVEGAIAAHGRLDVLVNNAGVVRAAPFGKTGEDVLDLHLGVNVKGTFLVTQAAVPHLTRHKGNVVNVSTNVTVQGVPGFSAYTASKGAINALTVQLAAELAPSGVRVNCVCPGVVETPIFESMMPPEEVPGRLEALAGVHPLGRIGRPADVAGAVLYLASADADWVTGVVLMVDGGATAV